MAQKHPNMNLDGVDKEMISAQEELLEIFNDDRELFMKTFVDVENNEEEDDDAACENALKKLD